MDVRRYTVRGDCLLSGAGRGRHEVVLAAYYDALKARLAEAENVIDAIAHHNDYEADCNKCGEFLEVRDMARSYQEAK